VAAADIWTRPEEPEEFTAAAEKTRIWVEQVPRVSPRDPRARCRPEPWTPPTPSTGATTPPSAATDGKTAVPELDEQLERGLKRQHSAPEVAEVVARPKLMRVMSAPESQRWREIAKDEWGNRGGAGGEGGPRPGRQAQCAGEEGRMYIPGEVGGLAGMRVFEEQRGNFKNENTITKTAIGLGKRG